MRLLEDGGGIAFDMKVTPEGTARPDEIIEALSGFAGRELKPARIVRTEIRLKEEEQPTAAAPGRPPAGPPQRYAAMRPRVYGESR